jgi:uncharacterized membrane protein YheB (UPF0754 family)
MDAPEIVRLVLIPIIAAATGYLTNFIAVRMLFRPRRPIRALGVSIHGLIPKRRAQIALSVGETVERHLISHDDVKAVLADPEVRARIARVVDDRLGDVIEFKLKTLHPMIGMFLKGEMVEKARALVTREVLDAVGPITESMVDHLEERLDFKQIVVSKIEGFDLDRFEEIVLSIASRELRAIEMLGGVLGFIIGLMTDLLLIWG